MFFGGLIIDLMFIGLGALMRYTSTEPNGVFGYRTSRAMSSPAAWAYANRRSGTLMMVVGLVCLALCMATALMQQLTPLLEGDAGNGIAAFLYMGIPVLGSIGIIPLVERELAKRFPAGSDPNAEGNREAACAPGGAIGDSLDEPLPTMGTPEKVALAVLLVLPLIAAALGLALAPLPDTIAVHFGADGADGWAPKANLLLFGGLMAGANALLLIAYRTFRYRQTGMAAGGAAARLLSFAVFALLMLLDAAMVLYVVFVNL